MILSPSLYPLLNKLLTQKQENTMISNILIEWLGYPEPLLNNVPSTSITQLQSSFFAQFETELSTQDVTRIRKQKPDEVFSILAVKPFLNNPYAQCVTPAHVTSHTWELTYETYEAFEPFVSGDVLVHKDRHYLEQTPIGFFDQRFRYLVLKQHDVTWMSMTPFEIITMQPILEKLSGSVVTLGLGLGYFAFMAASNPLVTHVTVIEKDATLIDLFNKHILPFFPNQSKLTILNMDALDYVKTPKDVDHMFVDIYHTAMDGWPLYLRFKSIESTWTKTTWSYWLESSILAYLRRFLMSFLEEQTLGYREDKYALTNDVTDELFHNLYRHTKSISVTDEPSLLEWLSDDSIKRLAATHLKSLSQKCS
jgi:hypothetical protein